MTAEEYGIPEELFRQYKASFDIFDKDGGGSISIKEFAAVMKSLGNTTSEAELQAMLKEVDEDGSGEIEFGEFVNLMQKTSAAGDKEAQLRATFTKFDTDGSGSITKAELKAAMAEMGQIASDSEIETMIAEADEDGNQEIDFEEFCKMMG